MKNLIKLILLLLVFSGCQTSKQIAKKEMLQKTIQSADLLLVSVKELKSHINKKILKDTNDISKVFVPLLINLEEQAADLRESVSNLDISNQEDLIKLNNLQEDVSMVIQHTQTIGYSLDKTFNMLLASDVSFETGKYQLNTQGIEVLESYVNVEIKNLVDYYEQNPHYKLATKLIRISIAGHADATGSANNEKRYASNLLLSQKRADAVKSQLELSFGKIQQKYNVKIIIESTGYGETLPSNLSIENTYQADPMRRVCQISGLVYPDFESMPLKKKASTKLKK